MKKFNLIVAMIFLLSIMNVSAFDTNWNTDIFDGSSDFINIGTRTLNYTYNNVTNNNIAYFMSGVNTSSINIVDDLSNNNNIGVLHEAIYLNELNGGWYFDGYDDHVNVSNSTSINLNNSLSVSVWLKIGTSPTPNGYILDKREQSYNQGYAFQYKDSADEIHLVFEDTDGNSTTCTINMTYFNLNEWINLVAIRNKPQARILGYVDGVLANNCSDITATGDIFTDQHLQIGYGGAENLGSEYFNGSISTIIIFNKSLSASEVSDLYNNQSLIFETSGNITTPYFTTPERNTTINRLTVDSDGITNLDGTTVNAKLRYWAPSFGGNQTGNFVETSYQTLSDSTVFTITEITNLTEDLNVTLVVQQTSTGMFTSYYSPTQILMEMSYTEPASDCNLAVNEFITGLAQFGELMGLLIIVIVGVFAMKGLDGKNIQPLLDKFSIDGKALVVVGFIIGIGVIILSNLAGQC